MSLRTAAFGLLLTLAPLLAGCGDFWQNPGGTSGSGGTTATSTTLSASPSAATVGDSITLTASVSPSAATGTVSFDSNSAPIGSGTLSSGTASTTTSFTTAGTYSLTAIYGGDSTYAQSTSSAQSVTVTAAASGTSAIGVFNPSNTVRKTNLVTDPANTWTLTGNSHVANLAGVAVDGDTIQNIEGDGHCVYYSGKLFPAAGARNASGVYALPGGGFVAPEGTEGLDCE
jgi:hypothetical protein